MIDAQSSALAAHLRSLKGCRKLAGHNMPGNRPPITPRPGGARERTSSFVDDGVLNLHPLWQTVAAHLGGYYKPQSNWISSCSDQNQAKIKPIKPFLTLFKPKKMNSIGLNLTLFNPAMNRWPLAKGAAIPVPTSVNQSAFICVDLRIKMMPFGSAILVQFEGHSISPLTHYGSAFCAISACEPAFRCQPKTRRVSRYPSTALDPISTKSHEKNPPFFSGHFDGKSLENQAKTAKKNPQKRAIILQLLTCFFAPIRQVKTPPSPHRSLRPQAKTGQPLTHPTLNHHLLPSHA